MDDWEKILSGTFERIDETEKKEQQVGKRIKQNRAKAEEFISSVVAPAFEELKPELEKHNQKVEISTGETSDRKEPYARINVRSIDPVSLLNFTYEIILIPRADFISISYLGKFMDKVGHEYELVPSNDIPNGFQGSDISGIVKDEVKRDFALKYQYMVERHLK